MIDSRRLVVCTPAGRRRYLAVLAQYVLGEDEVDEWQLWLNTEDAADLAWMADLAAREPRVKLVERAWPYEANFSIAPFFKGCVDPNAVYVRLDDDLVWAAPRAIAHLAAARLADPHPFLLHGAVVNSGLTSHLHQRFGVIPMARGFARYACMDDVGWLSGPFAVDLHRAFLADPTPARWRLPDRWRLHEYERHSINAVAWSGADAGHWAPYVDRDEEQWLSVEEPQRQGRPNEIVGGPVLFSHYAFYTQRAAVDAEPDVLAGYRRLAGLVD